MNRDIILVVLSGLLIAAVLLAGCVDEVSNNATVTPSPTFSPTPSSTVPETTWVIASEDELLGKYEKSDRMFERTERHGRIIYNHQRMIDEAVVEKDRRVYMFDNTTKELIYKDIQWRDDLPEHLPSVISEADAESIAKTVGKGKIMETSLAHTKLLYIASDSCWHPIKPTPENPCWIVYFADENGYNIDVIIIDAVEGKILGHGVPFP